MSQFQEELGILAAAGLVEGRVGGIYVNRAHGVAFRVPSGWVLQEVQQTAASQAGITLDFDNLDPEAFADYIRSVNVHAPYVTIADMASARFLAEATSPDVDHMATLAFIAFEGSWKEDGPLAEPFELEWYVRRDLAYYSSGYRNFQVVQGPKDCELSGCAAVEYIAEYSFAHAGLPFTVPTREHTIYVHQDPAIQGIRMIDFPRADPPLVFDYSSFVESVRFL